MPATTPGASVQSFAFSTREVPREEQFEAWRRSYAEMLDLTADDVAGGFRADHQVWDLGTFAFSRIHTQGLGYSSLPKRGRRDPLDHWLLTLFLDGRSTTLTDSNRLDGNTGMVQVHPLGRAFEGTVSRKNDLLMLFVPRDFCRDMAHILDAAAFSRLEGGMGRIFADYMISLARQLPKLDIADLPELAATTRAMLLACVSPSPERLEEAEDAISSVLLERARHYIQTHLGDAGLGAVGLPRELGISRSRLYRLFEPAGGVMHYIQRRRLAAAHAALADANDRRRILEIAECWCFNDGAEFSRAFRREFGYSPSEVRAGARRGSLSPLATRPDEEALPVQRLNFLLRRLQA